MKTYSHIVDKLGQHWLTDDQGHYFNGVNWVKVNKETAESQEFRNLGEITISDFLQTLTNIMNQEAL